MMRAWFSMSVLRATHEFRVQHLGEHASRLSDARTQAVEYVRLDGADVSLLHRS